MDYKLNDKIIVRGFSKIGRVVDNNPVDLYLTVEFERIKVQVDKKTQNIVLPSGCVTLQN
jgi:hypothetical protein